MAEHSVEEMCARIDQVEQHVAALRAEVEAFGNRLTPLAEGLSRFGVAESEASTQVEGGDAPEAPAGRAKAK